MTLPPTRTLLYAPSIRRCDPTDDRHSLRYIIEHHGNCDYLLCHKCVFFDRHCRLPRLTREKIVDLARILLRRYEHA